MNTRPRTPSIFPTNEENCSVPVTAVNATAARWMHKTALLLILLGLLALQSPGARATDAPPASPQSQPAQTFMVYLPLVVQAGTPNGAAPTVTSATTTATTPPVTATPTSVTATTTSVTATPTSVTATATSATATPTTITTTPPQGPSGALLFGDASFRSADVAVDANGGMHVVFTRIPPLSKEGERKPVFYAYCPGTNLPACDKREGWSLTEIDESFEDVQLELTPDGKPRMLLMRLVYFDNGSFLGGRLYRYAECSSNCADAQSWKHVDVTTSKSSGGLYESDYSYHTFALDHLGRPRFVYEDRASSSGAHRGSWYVFCDANCHALNSWFETRIDNDDGDGSNIIYINERTVLRFTSDGRPRLLTGIFDLDYVECNERCDLSANWSRPTSLFETGSGSSPYTWSFQLDRNGGLRATFYPRGGPFYYLWCHGSCTDPGKWQGYTLDVGKGSGAYSSLMLDQQDRPRIAYQDMTQTGLGYIWCNENCESEQGVWQGGLVEDDNAIDREHPIRPYAECPQGTWIGGMRPSLSLDKDGNPRIAYDAHYLMTCYRYPDDPNDRSTTTEPKWWTSRFIYFPQP